MKIISVGEYDLQGSDLDKLNINKPLDVALEKIIYSYKNYGYEGSGMIVYIDNKGGWHLDEFSHCSCNGPIDGGFNPINYELDQIKHLLKARGNENAKNILLCEDLTE